MSVTDGLQWQVERASGTASELHERSHDFSRRLMRVNQVTQPAVVLSSTQSPEVLDLAYVERLGLDVVRRSSGGGLVLLGLEDHLWIDYFLPRQDPLWVDDVSHSGEWLGSYWVDVLATIGIGNAVVTDGAWSDPELGRLVCFAAIGPGEVTVTGRKLVGVSQRRTRDGARFQSTVYRSFSPDVVMGLVKRGSVDPDLYARLRTGLSTGVASLSDLTTWDRVTASGGEQMSQLVRAAIELLPGDHDSASTRAG